MKYTQHETYLLQMYTYSTMTYIFYGFHNFIIDISLIKHNQ